MKSSFFKIDMDTAGGRLQLQGNSCDQLRLSYTITIGGNCYTLERQFLLGVYVYTYMRSISTMDQYSACV